MKKDIKPVSLVICLILAISLTACKGLLPTYDGSTQTSSTNNTAASNTGVQDGSWITDTSSWKIKDWYLENSSYTHVYDPVNILCDKILYEKTGLQNVQLIASENCDRLIAMIASNTLPEVLTISTQNKDLINMMEEEGYILPLMELIEKYAPDFKDELLKYPEMIEWYSSERDGKLYGLPNFANIGRKVRDLPAEEWQICDARRDLLYKVGIKPVDFNTQDGTVDALKKFVKSGITQKGQSIYPILMDEWSAPFDSIEWLAQTFGLINEDPITGEYVHSLMDPAFYDYVSFMNRLYREGLFTDQNLVMRAADVRELTTGSRVFFRFGFNGSGSIIRDVCKSTEGEIWYEPVGPVRASDGRDPAIRVPTISSGFTSTYVTKSAVHKDRIIRLLGYLFSDEGQIDMKWGKEGESYKKLDENTFEYTEDWKALDMTDVKARDEKYGTELNYFLLDGNYAWSFDVWHTIRFEDKDPWDQMLAGVFEQYNVYQYPGGIFDDIQNNAPAAGSPEADIDSQISLYLNQQTTRMIVAETEAELAVIYADTVKHAKYLGLDRVVKAKNERFQQMKMKLGIKFAYPMHDK